jgi:hypothetical protein
MSPLSHLTHPSCSPPPTLPPPPTQDPEKRPTFAEALSRLSAMRAGLEGLTSRLNFNMLRKKKESLAQRRGEAAAHQQLQPEAAAGDGISGGGVCVGGGGGAGGVHASAVSGPLPPRPRSKRSESRSCSGIILDRSLGSVPEGKESLDEDLRELRASGGRDSEGTAAGSSDSSGSATAIGGDLQVAGPNA